MPISRDHCIENSIVESRVPYRPHELCTRPKKVRTHGTLKPCDPHHLCDLIKNQLTLSEGCARTLGEVYISWLRQDSNEGIRGPKENIPICIAVLNPLDLRHSSLETQTSCALFLCDLLSSDVPKEKEESGTQMRKNTTAGNEGTFQRHLNHYPNNVFREGFYENVS